MRHHLLSGLRARLASASRAETTFCDDCGSACTPAQRYAARRDAERQKMQRSGLIRHF